MAEEDPERGDQSGKLHVRIVDKKKKGRSKSSLVKDLEKRLKEQERMTADYLNRLKYLQADFENYRKRMDREVEDMSRKDKETLIGDLLDILDELELAVRSGTKSGNKQALLEGVELTLKKLRSILEREGLAAIEALGKPFNPRLHEVVSKVPTEKHKEGTIIEDIRKGFMYKEKVIRPSMVKVAAPVGGES